MAYVGARTLVRPASRRGPRRPSSPAISTVFVRLRSPVTMRRLRLGMRSWRLSRSMRAALAAPSTGAAASFTCRTPIPHARDGRAAGSRGDADGEDVAALTLRRPSARRRHAAWERQESRPPRPVEQHLVLALLDVLLADELQRVAQGRDGALERALHVAPLQPEAVDLALHFLERATASSAAAGRRGPRPRAPGACPRTRRSAGSRRQASAR